MAPTSKRRADLDDHITTGEIEVVHVASVRGSTAAARVSKASPALALRRPIDQDEEELTSLMPAKAALPPPPSAALARTPAFGRPAARLPAFPPDEAATVARLSIEGTRQMTRDATATNFRPMADLAASRSASRSRALPAAVMPPPPSRPARGNAAPVRPVPPPPDSIAPAAMSLASLDTPPRLAIGALNGGATFVGRRSPALSWGFALVALGVLVGVVVALVARGEARALARAKQFEKRVAVATTLAAPAAISAPATPVAAATPTTVVLDEVKIGDPPAPAAKPATASASAPARARKAAPRTVAEMPKAGRTDRRTAPPAGMLIATRSSEGEAAPARPEKKTARSSASKPDEVARSKEVDDLAAEQLAAALR